MINYPPFYLVTFELRFDESLMTHYYHICHNYFVNMFFLLELTASKNYDYKLEKSNKTFVQGITVQILLLIVE